MDNLEYEFSGQSLSRNREHDFVIEVKPKEERNQQAAIDFSVNIIKALEGKTKAHNSSQSKKVTLNQLKKVFCESFEDRPSDEQVNSLVWAFAKVNLYLRIACGEHSEAFSVVNTYKKPNLVEISANWLPSQIDIEAAKSSIEEKGLTYKFTSLDELYINYQPIQWEID